MAKRIFKPSAWITSVWYFFPSLANIFSCPQNEDNYGFLLFKVCQNFRGVLVMPKASMISIAEHHQSARFWSQIARTSRPLNNRIERFIMLLYSKCIFSCPQNLYLKLVAKPWMKTNDHLIKKDPTTRSCFWIIDKRLTTSNAQVKKSW